MFSVQQTRPVHFAGGMGCYVVDRFVNRVSDTLEQGYVVVISKHESSIYSGTDNNTPLLEVDLTTKAYDTRVSRIVASSVAERDLPFVEALPEAPRTERSSSPKALFSRPTSAH